jgi:hypothetical protein
MNIFEFQQPVAVHSRLNPKLWKGNRLHKDVYKALMRIAGEFYKSLNVPAKLVDILITGSQVNYNYSPDSDLDLHLVIDFKDVDCDGGARELFNTKRAIWHQDHEITIHGIDVECYVEDVSDKTVSASYSLLHNRWKEEPPEPEQDFDEDLIKSMADHWQSKIDQAIETGSLSKCRKTRMDLKKFRVKSLAKGGEYDEGNLAFKALRNSGYIDKLMSAIRHYDDKRLSI